MDSFYRIRGDEAQFVVLDVEPRFEDAIQTAGFTRTDEGFIRSFPANAAHLDRIFSNFQGVLPDLLAQTAKLVPIPWEDALLLFLSKTEGMKLDWYVVGSAALALRGMPVSPGDVDLVTAEADAAPLTEHLLDYVIHPLVATPGWVGTYFTRAFMGAKLEWMGGTNESADQPSPSDFGPTAASQLEIIHWHGYEVRIPPLDLSLDMARRRGLHERAALIELYLKQS